MVNSGGAVTDHDCPSFCGNATPEEVKVRGTNVPQKAFWITRVCSVRVKVLTVVGSTWPGKGIDDKSE